MYRIHSLILLLLASCAANVIQTRDRSVVCKRDGRIELSSVIDPQVYILVFTREHYELRLVDSHRAVAKYDQCYMEIFPPPTFVEHPDTR
ncbi:MAG: hypothetical protein NTX72_02175 [Candidatus Uhrbacteria bacterium]|nr:hypothetical protein [Candidatus Uhrbacteria bacterium]